MINTNAYKALPFTLELDWRTGNTLLNFHQIQCKAVVTKEALEAIAGNRRLFEVHGGVPMIRQGNIYQNQFSIVKVVDITSENYDSGLAEREDARVGDIIIAEEPEYDKGIFVINSANEVFLRDTISYSLIRIKMVIYADLSCKDISYKAMPYDKFIETFAPKDLIAEGSNDK